MRTILLLGATAAALSIAGCDRQKAGESQASAPAQVAGTTVGVDRSQAGTPAPAITFKDGDGQDTNLAAFAGKPLLVNLWATWCAPCVKELPTLDALADRPGAPQVLALSQDTAPAAEVRAFLAERKIALDAHQDADMAMSGALGANILPMTVLYGSDGKEIWRYTGDLDWTGEKAAALLKEAL